MDGLDALHQGLIYFRPMAIVKPQSQNPKKYSHKIECEVKQYRTWMDEDIREEKEE